MRVPGAVKSWYLCSLLTLQPMLPVEPYGISPCVCVSHLLLSDAFHFPKPPRLMSCPAVLVASAVWSSSLVFRSSQGLRLSAWLPSSPCTMVGKVPCAGSWSFPAVFLLSKGHSPALPAVLCLKTVVSFILFSFAFA